MDYKTDEESNKLKRILKKHGIHSFQELEIQRDLGLLSLSSNEKNFLDKLQEKHSFLNNEKRSYEEHAIDSKWVFTTNFVDHSDVRIISSVGSLWREKNKNSRNFWILVNYYNNRPEETLQKLGNQYGLTRERVRQIISEDTKKLRYICDEDTSIRTSFLTLLDYFASEVMVIDSLIIEDEFFTNKGIANLFSNMYPQRYEVFKDRRLCGEWWIKPNGNLGKSISTLLRDLKSKSGPISLSSLEKIYSINPKMGLMLDAVDRKDGFLVFGNKNRGHDALQQKNEEDQISNKIPVGLNKDNNNVFSHDNLNAKKESLEEFINMHINKEIELRYKTFQSDSYKRWRRVIVSGQDKFYVFAHPLYGKKRCYDKAKIMEYRDPLEKYYFGQ